MVNINTRGVVVALSILLSACGSGVSGPSENQVSEAVQKEIRDGLKIDSIRFEIFPSEDKTQGRISVAGKLVAAEDRATDRDQGWEGLVSKVKTTFGVSEEQALHYISKLRPGESNLYGKLVSAGTKFEFSGELHYMKIVDGFTIRGDVKSEVPGRTISSLSKGALIYDSPEYEEFFQRFIALHNDETVKLPNMARDVFSKLTDGAKIVYGDTVLATIEPFNLNLDSWKVKKIYNGTGYVEAYTSTSLIPININALTDFAIGMIPLTIGDNGQFAIALRIYTPDNPDPKKACLNLHRESVGGTGEVCWDGSLWKWNGSQFLLLNGIEDRRSNKQLSIKP